ncbi:hypothetical protein LJR084_003379 [Variovorax sp. LjRoot84]
MTVSQAAYRAVRKECRTQLTTLRGWSGVRNKATGHYDEDTADQVRMLDTIDIDDVMAVFNASMRINREFLALLKDAGRGGPGPQTAFGAPPVAIRYGPGLAAWLTG